MKRAIPLLLLVGACSRCEKAPAPPPAVAEHPDAAVARPPVADVDVKYTDEEKDVKRVHYRVHYPRFTEAAIAAQIDSVVDRVRGCVDDKMDGSCEADCDATLTTSTFVSVHCQSMIGTGTIEEHDKGMGGAPGDYTHETWTWALENGKPRLLKVEDVFTANRLPALANEVVRLDHEAHDDKEPSDPITKAPEFVQTFTVSREGVTFYPSGEEKVTYRANRPSGTWSEVKRFVRADGAGAKIAALRAAE